MPKLSSSLVALLISTTFILACTAQQNEQQSQAFEPVEWRMVTTWPRGLPGLGTGAQKFAEQVGKISNGQLTIRYFAAGELVPALQVFDTVVGGAAQIGHAAAYYWRGKLPAAQFFTTVPFGFIAQEYDAWYWHGGGRELHIELYQPYGIYPIPMGNSGAQMGGFFNKRINSVADLQGLKMRIPGLGGEIMRELGVAPQTIAGGEIFTSLQTGVIDAAEWIGPYNDSSLGLDDIASYYYYPGWHEPGPSLELIINQQAWDALPEHLQAAVQAAAAEAGMLMLSEYTARNATSLQAMLGDGDVEILPFPADVLQALRRATAKVIDSLIAQDEMSRRVYASIRNFQQVVSPSLKNAEGKILAERYARQQ